MALHQHNTILFGTFKRDGSLVHTPVWCAGDEDRLFVFSAGNAGKIKRLKNFTACTVAPCNFRGLRRGEDQGATATILTEPQAIAAAHRQLVDKYGWQMRLLDLGARLGRRYRSRAWVAIQLKSD